MSKFLILTLLLLAMTCSKDDENIGEKDYRGEFIAENDSVSMYLRMNGTRFVESELWFKGERNGEKYGDQLFHVNNDRDNQTKGQYPHYTLSIVPEYWDPTIGSITYPSNLDIDIEFADETHFTGVLNGTVKNNWAGNEIVFEDLRLNFKKSNKLLDSNGDGMLDSLRPI